MNEQQLRKIEHSFKHSNCCVFRIGERVFVSEEALKHRKEATIEFVECYEIDETCFENGEYYGETLNERKTIILADPYADNENIVETNYYEDELVEEIVK